jgi:hypothetical protein
MTELPYSYPKGVYEEQQLASKAAKEAKVLAKQINRLQQREDEIADRIAGYAGDYVTALSEQAQVAVNDPSNIRAVLKLMQTVLRTDALRELDTIGDVNQLMGYVKGLGQDTPDERAEQNAERYIKRKIYSWAKTLKRKAVQERDVLLKRRFRAMEAAVARLQSIGKDTKSQFASKDRPDAGWNEKVKATLFEAMPKQPVATDKSYVYDEAHSGQNLYPEQRADTDDQPANTLAEGEWGSDHQFGLPPYYDKYYRGYKNAFEISNGKCALQRHIEHILQTNAGCKDPEDLNQDQTCWVVDGANLFRTDQVDRLHRAFDPMQTTDAFGRTKEYYDYPEHAKYIEWKRDRIRQDRINLKETDKFGPVIVVFSDPSYRFLQDPLFPDYGQVDQRPYVVASLSPLHNHAHPVIFVVVEAVEATHDADVVLGSKTLAKLHRYDGHKEKLCAWQQPERPLTVPDHMWCEFDDYVAARIVHFFQKGRAITREGGEVSDANKGSRALGSPERSFGLDEKTLIKYGEKLAVVKGAFRIRVFGLNTHYVAAYSRIGFDSTTSWLRIVIMKMEMDHFANVDHSADVDRLVATLLILLTYRPKDEIAFPTKDTRICLEQMKKTPEDTPHGETVSRLVDAVHLLQKSFAQNQSGLSAQSQSQGRRSGRQNNYAKWESLRGGPSPA